MENTSLRAKVSKLAKKPFIFWIKTGFVLISFVVFVIVFKNLFYLYKEFIINNNIYSYKEIVVTHSTDIPRHIHQVFFSKEIPENFLAAQRTCRDMHKDFEYTFWDREMVDSLVQQHYPGLQELFDSYGHWVNRADVARYIIMRQHGGIYLDMDTICKQR